MKALVDPRHEHTVEAYFRALVQPDADAWLALFTDDAVSHDPVGTPPASGREELRQIRHVMTSPFKKLVIAAPAVFYAGSGAAAHWSAQGTAEGGASVRFAGITVFELAEDGRIQTVMSYWDPAAMMIELADAGRDSGSGR